MKGMPLLLLAVAGSAALTAKPAWADDSAAPGDGFSASRYETLWTKSPFAVATAEAVQESLCRAICLQGSLFLITRMPIRWI